MRVLIIGVNGFSGIHLVRQLVERSGYKIFGSDIQENTFLDKDLECYHKLDITNFEMLKRIVKEVKPDIIYNLSGLFNSENFKAIYEVNLMGVINILEAVKEVDPQNIKMLFVGSAAEYGITPNSQMPITEESLCNPANPYAISKYAATLTIKNYVKKHNLKAVVVRPFNIIGMGVPDSLFVGALLGRIKTIDKNSKPMPLEVGNINTYRDFIDIKDVVTAYVDIMTTNCWGQVFNLCSGVPTKIQEVLELVISFSNKKIEYAINPAFVRADDVISVYGSSEKAKSSFGFKPKKTIKESLKEAWDYTYKIK
jgi:GDP-4-dehydro-6-deoxy-D-mannose reductase